MENNKSSSDAITRAYLDSLLVEMRHLDAIKPDISFELFGKRFDTPVMTAALSHLNKVRENGMAEFARGAAIANAVMFCGMGSNEELDAVTDTGASVIKIVKPYANRKMVFERIEHACERGCLAVGMDIDHAFGFGTSNYDEVDGMKMYPVSSEELSEFIKAASPLPFVVKGVLSVQDAVKCIDTGAAAMVLSHHNGRLEYAVPPLFIIKSIINAIGSSVPLFIDCSLSSGMDVFKALALGASACCVGRPLMKSLAESGAQGVAGHIREISEHLSYAMAMTCSPDIRHIDPSVVKHSDTFIW